MAEAPISSVVTHQYESFDVVGQCIHGNDFELYKLSELLDSWIVTRIILDFHYDYSIDESVTEERTDRSDPYTAEMNFRHILASTPSNHSWEELKTSTIRPGKGNFARFVAVGKDIQRVWLNFTLFSRRQSVHIYDIIAKVTTFPRPELSLAGDSMLVTPIFRARDFGVKQHNCFVLMPFSLEWSSRVWKHLRRIVMDLGLECRRADDLYGPNILEDIWTAINEATIVIADITSRNPNVFYEVGIAHTLGKRVILLSQSANDIPFDFKIYRHLIYADNIDGFEKLSEQLPLFVAEAMRSHNE